MLTAPVFPSDLAAGLIGDGVFPRERLPLERVGTEEEMAGTILYLTSRAGAYCSGNVMVVDGGRLSVLPSTYCDYLRLRGRSAVLEPRRRYGPFIDIELVDIESRNSIRSSST